MHCWGSLAFRASSSSCPLSKGPFSAQPHTSVHYLIAVVVIVIRMRMMMIMTMKLKVMMITLTTLMTIIWCSITRVSRWSQFWSAEVQITFRTEKPKCPFDYAYSRQWSSTPPIFFYIYSLVCFWRVHQGFRHILW